MTSKTRGTLWAVLFIVALAIFGALLMSSWISERLTGHSPRPAAGREARR
jgi:hypothetical protein